LSGRAQSMGAMGLGDIAPRILVCDIEISFDIIATYGLREQYHSPENIIQDWFMICFAWQWLDGDKVHAYSLLNDPKRFRADRTDDYAVVKRLHKLMSEADIVIGHNFDRFDWKKFYGKVMVYGLPPISKPLIVDTYKEAKKLAVFTSNKLDYLTKHFDVENLKQKHASDMWLKILLYGDRKAIREAVGYCKGDISATKDLYLRMRPYMEAHPNLNLWRADGIECCTACNGTHLNKHKNKITRTGRYMQYQCQDCGKIMAGVKRVKAVSIK